MYVLEDSWSLKPTSGILLTDAYIYVCVCMCYAVCLHLYTPRELYIILNITMELSFEFWAIKIISGWGLHSEIPALIVLLETPFKKSWVCLVYLYCSGKRNIVATVYSFSCCNCTSCQYQFTWTVMSNQSYEWFWMIFWGRKSLTVVVSVIMYILWQLC